MRELRPKLESEAAFVALVQRQQAEGYRLAWLEHEGEVVSLAGFRVQQMLSSGLTLYVDDLVTGAAFRSKGHGKAMLDWLVAQPVRLSARRSRWTQGRTGLRRMRFTS
jgi:hypothetical protein